MPETAWGAAPAGNSFFWNISCLRARHEGRRGTAGNHVRLLVAFRQDRELLGSAVVLTGKAQKLKKEGAAPNVGLVVRNSAFSACTASLSLPA